MMTSAEDTTFRFFPILNNLKHSDWLSSGGKIRKNTRDKYFSADTLQDKVVSALVNNRVINIKEILEAFEFFARIRKEVRSECVVDLCCGHGLLGVLFAIFERKVEKVILVDKIEPLSRKRMLDCLQEVTPWISEKIETRSDNINSDMGWLPKNCSIVSSHACGHLTDRCIELAIKVQGNIAVLPCCHPEKSCPAPSALGLALGHDLAHDIDRTYRLENAGYYVKWRTIPAVITPKNRIISAIKRA